jgi:hypothetical protein
MKIIGFIEDDEIIEKILQHLGLWETRSHDPPNQVISRPPTIKVNSPAIKHIYNCRPSTAGSGKITGRSMSTSCIEMAIDTLRRFCHSRN